MKILLVSQYFYPESFIINDVVRNLVQQGHEVVVLTGKPNYPDGTLFSGYKGWGVKIETFAESVTVIRVPLIPRHNGRSFWLILNYLSFMLTSCILGPIYLRRHTFDQIFVYALSPPTQIMPALLVKWLRKIPVTVWVQDLWPESLSETNHVKNPFILSGVARMMRFFYRHTDLILMQSAAFKEPLMALTEAHKLQYFPNCVDSHSPSSSEPLPHSVTEALNHEFVVLFAGNLGIAQNLDAVITAAELAKNNPSIRFVLLGSGSRLNWLQEEQKKRQLSHLFLPGRIPASMMTTVYKQAAVLLVSLRAGIAFERTIPSKVQDYLLAGKPILAAMNGEGARIVTESGAGLVCASGNGAALYQRVLELKAMLPHERQHMGILGKQYFDEHFDMKRQVSKLVNLLPAAIGKTG